MYLSIISFFIIGTIFGSFYNVVAYRITKGESIVFPPSSCPNCKHKLTPWELIPIFSFIIQGGKCRNCKNKMSLFYPLSECMCGILFALSYLSFGFSYELIIALTFVSVLDIVILSDYYYMIIEDCVLIFFGVLLLIEVFFINGFDALITSLIGGLISFLIMFAIKLLGDFIFKRESMGGGDIKLMIIIGFIIGYEMAAFSIFLASLLALPICLFTIKSKKNHEIPFGPFLSFASIIIYLLNININQIFDFVRGIIL